MLFLFLKFVSEIFILKVSDKIAEIFEIAKLLRFFDIRWYLSTNIILYWKMLMVVNVAESGFPAGAENIGGEGGGGLFKI